MESLNRNAVELVDEALDFAEELDVAAYELDSGATVLDFGVDVDGGVEAGLLLSEIQTAGIATVQSRLGEVAGTTRQYVELATDHPGLALLCSQKAGWELEFDGFDGLGSGPARALVGREAEFEAMGYYDEFDLTTLAVESTDLPDDRVARHVADLANVEESAVFLPTYPAASLVGSVTMAARAAELAVFQLFELGYDPRDVVSAAGAAPVAPVAGEERQAVARTNDALAYGGEVTLTVREDSDLFGEVPSTAAADAGRPFADIFGAADWDFSEVPAELFAPARVTVDVLGGPTHVHGETDEELLAESFGL